MLTYLRKHMKAIMIIIAVLFAASMFYGLGFRGIQDQSLSKRGFLKVNGQEVDILRFNQIYSRLRESFPANLKPQEALFLQNLALNQTIDYALILEEARKKVRVSGGELNQVLEDLSKNQKFSSVSDFKKAVEKSGLKWNDLKRIVRDDILVSRMVNQVKAEVSVSANDLREVRARHILVKDEKLAQELLGRVKKGEDFAALAKKYSEDPGSRDKGGDLGFFPAGAMLKPFDNLAFSLKVGEIGGPVKTDFGYHIIKVEDARLRKIPGKTDPEKAILEEKQERAYQEWFYKLKQKAKVEIEDPSLRALDLRFKGRLGESVLEYQKAIRANPRNAYLHVFLATLYEETGKTDLAISEYQEAVRAEAGDPTLYLLLGQTYLRNKKTELAVEQFKKASLIAGDRKPLHEELLKAFQELKMSSLAAQEKAEIVRIEKKEAFEKGLMEKSKVKTE